MESFPSSTVSSAPRRSFPLAIRCAKLAACFLVAAVLTGCGASSQFMKPARSVAKAPPADKALVHFLRPSNYAKANLISLFDGEKAFLGDALPKTYWVKAVEPGEHWFLAHAENVSAVKAELEAGKSYYLVVRPYMGVWDVRANLTALTPESEDWGKRQAWLDSSTPHTVDAVAGQAEMDAEEIAEKLAEGQAAWKELNEADRTKHSLRPADGI